MKVCIATSRPIGERCQEWAKEHLPHEFELTDNYDEAEIFISVLYDKIISKEFIDSKQDCLNFHPGILPGFRGAGAFSWAIINEEEKTGITLHKIDVSIDHGDIIDIRKFSITNSDTAYSLFTKAEEVLFQMFKDWFIRLINRQYKIYKQDKGEAGIYYRKDLEKIKDLTRYVRALHFPDKESAYYYNRKGEKTYINYEKIKQRKYKLPKTI